MNVNLTVDLTPVKILLKYHQAMTDCCNDMINELDELQKAGAIEACDYADNVVIGELKEPGEIRACEYGKGVNHE